MQDDFTTLRLMLLKLGVHDPELKRLVDALEEKYRKQENYLTLLKSGWDELGKEQGAHDYITVIDCASLSPLADNITPRFDAPLALASLERMTTGVSSYRHVN